MRGAVGSSSQAPPSAHRIWGRPRLGRMGWAIVGGWWGAGGVGNSQRVLVPPGDHFSWLQKRVRVGIWGGLSRPAPRVGFGLGQQGCIAEQVLPQASLGMFHGDQREPAVGRPRPWVCSRLPSPGVCLSVPLPIPPSPISLSLSLCLCLCYLLLPILPALSFYSPSVSL